MKSRFGCICSLACLMSLPGVSASAELTLATGIRYFDYEEFDTSHQSLDRETGFIPGISVAGGTRWLGIDHSIEFGAWGGTVDYDGRTQFGQPHRTDTDETIYRVLYRTDWQPRDADGSLYTKVYWQNWKRDIQASNGVSSLFEHYQWWSIEAGLRATAWRQHNKRIAFELGVLRTSHGTILIDLSSNGYGEPVLDLGDGLGASMALDYEVELADRDRLSFSLGYQRWRFGRSNSYSASNGASTIVITEPDSIANHVIVSVAYHFHY